MAAAWLGGAHRWPRGRGARPSIPSLPARDRPRRGRPAARCRSARLRAERGAMSQAMRLAGLLSRAARARRSRCIRRCSRLATEAKERLIASEFGPQAVSMREDLQQRLQHAVEQIDARPPAALVQLGRRRRRIRKRRTAPSPSGRGPISRRYRVTSAVELYGTDGRRLSRFALSLPENADDALSADAGCNWELFDEVSPPRSRTERASHVLRASRGICVGGRPVGGIVVRVMLDYRTLPFISSQSPYLESLRPEPAGRAREASRAATSSSSSTAGAARRSTRPAPASGRCPMRCSSGWSNRASRSGPTRRTRRRDASASTSSATAAASTRSAIR